MTDDKTEQSTSQKMNMQEMLKAFADLGELPEQQMVTKMEEPKQNTKKRHAADKTKTSKNRQLRDDYWPELDETNLWMADRNRPGYTPIPRAMPHIFNIMDFLAGKGKPISSVYFSLWCRCWADSFLKIDVPLEVLATEAGFSGQRAVSVWKQRMKKLVELGFIEAKATESNEFALILFWNPYKIILQHKDKIPESKFNTLLARVREIGATDFD